jgi:xylulokinase
MTATVIGLDLGTSSYKAAAFDADGRMVAIAAATPTSTSPRPGWSEQEPADLVSIAVLALRRLVAAGVDPATVQGIGLTGQLGGIVLVDDAGEAIGQHEIWLDNRCQPYREALLRAHGREVLAKNGIHPYLGPRLRWRASERPDEYARAAKAMQCWPFVGATLAGLAPDQAYNDATSIGIFGVADAQAGAWLDDLCKLAGVDPAHLPRIVQPDEIVGSLTAEWAAATGLREGTPIVAGVGDGIAGWLGCGAVTPGVAVDTVGSSDHFAIATPRFAPDPDEQVLTTFRSAVPGLWHVFGFTAGSGLSHQWFLREFCHGLGEPADIAPGTWDAMEAAAATIPPGSEQLVFIPHLEGRFCPDQPNVRGTWLGFTWRHSRPHFYRSILESIACEYAHYLAAARRLGVGGDLREVRVVGGGAASALWNQIKADVLGVDYLQLTPANYTCRGAAICAGVATGLYPELAGAATRDIEVVRRFTPDAKAHERYETYAAHYRSLLDELAPAFDRTVTLP